MQFIKNKNITVTLQLVKSDLSYESDADVTFTIYNNDTTTIEISATDCTFNETLNCYTGSLVTSTGWLTQEDESYILKWDIDDDNEYFADTMVEIISVIPNSEDVINTIDERIDRILGLVHENMLIDNPVYDYYNNLIGARLRIYSDALSVGTSNNVIGTYTIDSDGDGAGKFNYWKQTKDD